MAVWPSLLNNSRFKGAVHNSTGILTPVMDLKILINHSQNVAFLSWIFSFFEFLQLLLLQLFYFVW